MVTLERSDIGREVFISVRSNSELRPEGEKGLHEAYIGALNHFDGEGVSIIHSDLFSLAKHCGDKSSIHEYILNSEIEQLFFLTPKLPQVKYGNQ